MADLSRRQFFIWMMAGAATTVGTIAGVAVSNGFAATRREPAVSGLTFSGGQSVSQGTAAVPESDSSDKNVMLAHAGSVRRQSRRVSRRTARRTSRRHEVLTD